MLLIFIATYKLFLTINTTVHNWRDDRERIITPWEASRLYARYSRSHNRCLYIESCGQIHGKVYIAASPQEAALSAWRQRLRLTATAGHDKALDHRRSRYKTKPPHAPVYVEAALLQCLTELVFVRAIYWVFRLHKHPLLCFNNLISINKTVQNTYIKKNKQTGKVLDIPHCSVYFRSSPSHIDPLRKQIDQYH